MLRIRDNCTVKELNIPKDKLEVLKKMMASKTIMDAIKHTMIPKLCEGSACCICRSIPSHKVIYHLDSATRMETYCEACIKKVYEITPVL